MYKQISNKPASNRQNIYKDALTYKQYLVYKTGIYNRTIGYTSSGSNIVSNRHNKHAGGGYLYMENLLFIIILFR